MAGHIDSRDSDIVLGLRARDREVNMNRQENTAGQQFDEFLGRVIFVVLPLLAFICISAAAILR